MPGDGTRVISASEDNSLRVWDFPTGEQLFTLNNHHNLLRAAAISFDGTRIIYAPSPTNVHIWDTTSRRDLCALTVDDLGPINAIALSADGTRIILGCPCSIIRICDTRTGEKLIDLVTPSPPLDVAISRDGTGIAFNLGNTVVVWDTGAREPLRTFCGYLIESIALSSDGTRVVCGSHDGSVCVWAID